MNIPRLGNDPLSLPEANRIYNDAQLLFKRYDPNISLDKSEISNNLTIDKNTYAVRGNDKIIGVVRGSVYDRDTIIRDMTRLSALRGQIGEVMADITASYAKAKREALRVEGRLYNKYTSNAYSEHGVAELANVPKTKITKDNLNALVLNDEEYTKIIDVLDELDRNKSRCSETQDGLIDLENALKKALEYGEKAQ